MPGAASASEERIAELGRQLASQRAELADARVAAAEAAKDAALARSEVGNSRCGDGVEKTGGQALPGSSLHELMNDAVFLEGLYLARLKDDFPPHGNCYPWWRMFVGGISSCVHAVQIAGSRSWYIVLCVTVLGVALTCIAVLHTATRTWLACHVPAGASSSSSRRPVPLPDFRSRMRGRSLVRLANPSTILLHT
jgi:hypothetical protein